MKSIDLVVVGGAKASQKAVLPLITGKNIVGSDKDCNCNLSWKQVQSKHFELLVAKSGDITLIPQVDGMQIQMPNGKMKELDAFSCYSLATNRRFYIDRAIGFSFDMSLNKKQKEGKNTNKKGSVWTPTQSDEEVELKKKQKKQQESEDEEVEEVTPVKAVAKKAQGKASKSNGKAEKTKKKQAKEITPVQTDEEDAEEEEEDEEASEIEEEEKEETPKRKPTRQAAPVNQKKGKKNQEQQSSERLHCTKETYKIILSNCELTPSQKSAMERLGANFTDDINDNFYIVLMDTFKRRAKLLVGLNSGAKIISKEWVEDCIQEKELIPKLDDYFLEIAKTDSKQFGGLDLDKIQKSAKGRKPYSLFAKYSFILPDETENNNDLIAIIESGNGIIVADEDENQGSKSKTTLIQLISKENYKKNKTKLSKSIKYADPEFVLLSSLKQEVQEQLFFN